MMKTWFQVHGLRKQRSISALPVQGQVSSDSNVTKHSVPLPTSSTRKGTAAKLAASQTASRMSIERYLQAPLEDEPASVPAIDAALKSQGPTPNQQYHNHGRGHSREISYDANSEGRNTYYTFMSGPESTGTSLGAASKSNRQGRNISNSKIPQLPKLSTAALEHVHISSPDDLATGRTMDSEKTLAELSEGIPPGQLVDRAYRARIEAELAHIQQKARRLEEEMQRFNEEKEHIDLLVPNVTDEVVYGRMASKPKLTPILGSDGVDVRGRRGPTEAANIAKPTSNDPPSRPNTSGKLTEKMHNQTPRRTKSSSALQENVHRQAKRQAVMVQRTSSRRRRFFCTFCQEKFHSEAEWVRHEESIHVSEEVEHNYLKKASNPMSYHSERALQKQMVVGRQKPAAPTGMLEAWRQRPSLEQGSPALHCGFCGLTFPTYRERTEHVAEHFKAGADMMSWWDARVSHEITPSAKRTQDKANRPHRCRYCNRTYATLEAARESHAVCTMWSCSFMPGMQYTIYPSGIRPNLEVVCCYCNESLARGNGKVKGAVLREHINTHNFRNCDQTLYFSAQVFRQHLQEDHSVNYDGTLFAGWTLLLKSSKQVKTSVFEALDSASLRPAYTDGGAPSARQASKKTKAPPEARMNFMDFSETPQMSSTPRKKMRRKPSAQTMHDGPIREVRDSTLFFTHAATMDSGYGETAPLLFHDGATWHKDGQQHRLKYPLAWRPVDAATPDMKFYRRILDASRRNRLYIRDESQGPLTKRWQRVFQKVPSSTFGSLVLHSSLLGVTPARLTNSVDMYPLR